MPANSPLCGWAQSASSVLVKLFLPSSVTIRQVSPRGPEPRRPSLTLPVVATMSRLLSLKAVTSQRYHRAPPAHALSSGSTRPRNTLPDCHSPPRYSVAAFWHWLYAALREL